MLTYTEYRRKYTSTAMDVVYALKKLPNPMTLYGYETGKITARGNIVNGNIVQQKKK